MYEATGGDARRVMHFLDHRSLDETQKYIDRLVAHALRQDHLVRFASAVRPFWVVVKIMPDDLRHAADSEAVFGQRFILPAYREDESIRRSTWLNVFRPRSVMS